MKQKALLIGLLNIADGLGRNLSEIMDHRKKENIPEDDKCRCIGNIRSVCGCGICMICNKKV
jgi:hypothetical protein